MFMLNKLFESESESESVDHSTPMYLSELVKKKSSSTNTRLANDDLLLVIPPCTQ